MTNGKNGMAPATGRPRAFENRMKASSSPTTRLSMTTDRGTWSRLSRVTPRQNTHPTDRTTSRTNTPTGDSTSRKASPRRAGANVP